MTSDFIENKNDSHNLQGSKTLYYFKLSLPVISKHSQFCAPQIININNSYIKI